MKIDIEIKNSSWVGTLLSVLFGIILCLLPGLLLDLVCRVLAVIIIVYGASRIMDYIRAKERPWTYQVGLTAGIVLVLIGLFILIKPNVVVSILPVMFGIFILVTGLGSLQRGINLKRAGYDKWWTTVLIAALTAILGLVIVFNPFATMETTLRVVGAVMVVTGGAELVSMLLCKKSMK